MARKTTTIINCDNPSCKEYAEVEDLKHSPEGWYRVAQSNERGQVPTTTGGFDLCSLKCVEKWSRERRFALEGSGKPGTNTQTLKETRALILMALEDVEMGSWTTSHEIQEATGLAQSTVDRHLTEMGMENIVAIKEGSSTKHNPRQFRLLG